MRFPDDSDASGQHPRSPYAVSSAGGAAWQEQRTSALAILSLISGIVAFPMMCLCFLSIPFSLFAIISGHLARGMMRRTPGRYSGHELALIGLVAGYFSLILTGLMLVLGAGYSTLAPRRAVNVSRQIAPVRQQQLSEVLLEEAEARLLRETTPATFANDSLEGDSSRLARHFVESLSEADALLFSETAADSVPDELQNARSYRAFVQLNSDSCAILLYVPEWSRFTESARDTLAQVAWLTAQKTLESVLPEGSGLAVAIYSGQGAENVMIGQIDSGEEFGSGQNSSHAGRKQLIRFFPKTPRPQRAEESAEATFGESSSRIDTNPSVSELPVGEDQPGLPED